MKSVFQGILPPFPHFPYDHIGFLTDSGTAFPASAECIFHFICQNTTAAGTYGYIPFIQKPDRLYFVILSETSQEFPASDQVPAERDHLTFIMVTQETVMTDPYEPLRRDMH